MFIRLLKVIGFILHVVFILAPLYFPFLIIFGNDKTERLILDPFYFLVDL